MMVNGVMRIGRSSTKTKNIAYLCFGVTGHQWSLFWMDGGMGGLARTFQVSKFDVR